MAYTRENRRKIGRRKRRRRTYDALQGRATKEERLQYDRLLWSIWLDEDRRVQERRSGEDRRETCSLAKIPQA